jgi:hypothetical protein
MAIMFKNAAKMLPGYLFFLIPSLAIGLSIWTIFVDGKLYYCSDKFLVLDFIPPFVHGAQYGDYWIVPPIFVWSIWLLLIISMFTIPYFLAKRKQSSLHR